MTAARYHEHAAALIERLPPEPQYNALLDTEAEALLAEVRALLLDAEARWRAGEYGAAHASEQRAIERLALAFDLEP